MPANSATYPLQGATTSSTQLTVDYLLNTPKVIARDFVNIAREQLWVGEVFDMGVSTDSGAVVVEKAIADINTDLYLTRGIERVTPLAEPNIVEGDRGVLDNYQIETWAAGYPISVEARRRNDVRLFNRQQLQLAQSMQLLMHLRGVTELQAAATANSRVVAAPQTLDTINAKTYNSKTNQDSVLESFLIAQTSANAEERGVVYDTALISTADNLKFGRALGFTGGVADAFASIGLKVIVSNRVTTGTAFLVQSKRFGGFAWELQPTIHVGDYDRSIRGYWVDGEAAFVPYVDDPFAVYQVTTL